MDLNKWQRHKKIWNQRTSGPVNAHLTPGPGIYFNAFIHVYSPRAGADNPFGTNVDVNRKPLSLCPFVAGLKKKLLWSPIVYTFFSCFTIVGKILMTTERPFLFAHIIKVSKWSVRNLILYTFWCQQKALITLTICCKFQTNLFEFWFYTYFLMFFHMYIAPGQGQTTLRGQNSDVNRKALSLCPFVASFKKISLKSDFKHIFACFYTCI